MVNSLVRGALVALALGSGLAGLGTAPASAQSFEVVIGDGMRGEPVQYRDYYDRGDGGWGRPDDRGPPDGWGRRGDGWGRRGDWGRPGFCDPDLAVRKAYNDFGMNRPRVVAQGRRSVIVEGWRRGHIASARFANDRGCPVIGFRR